MISKIGSIICSFITTIVVIAILFLGLAIGIVTSIKK